MSDGLKSILRKAAFGAALVCGLLAGSAQAATLYISEFATGVSTIGSQQAQIYPQASLTDQTVALSGTTARSAAFNAKTHAVMLMCDQGCSVAFGGSSVTAATTNYLLQQGIPYTFSVSPATFVAGITNAAGTLVGSSGAPAAVATSDPCTSGAKSSAAISVATAATTSLVAVSGTTKVYVCAFSMTIAPSATAADTAAFEYGTGASCTSPTLLTGTYGNGDLTSAAAVVPVNSGAGDGTIFSTAASSGLCIVTTGTAVSVQGAVTYVQQ